MFQTILFGFDKLAPVVVSVYSLIYIYQLTTAPLMPLKDLRTFLVRLLALFPLLLITLWLLLVTGILTYGNLESSLMLFAHFSENSICLL